MTAASRAGLLAATAGTATAVALAGCGSYVISYGNIKKAIKREIAALGVAETKIDCPGNQSSRKGTTFLCKTTLTDGQVIPFRVTVTDKKADAHVDPVGSLPVIVGKKIEAQIRTTLAGEKTPAASVTCPVDEPERAGLTFDCQSTLTSGEHVTFKVTAENSSGEVRYAPRTLVATLIERQIESRLAARKLTAKATCPRNVPINIGATFTCQLVTPQGQHATVPGTITGPLGQVDLGQIQTG